MSINEIRTTPLPVPLAKPMRKTTGKQFQNELDSASPAALQQHNAKQMPSALTNSEKDYFERLFPDSPEEVKRHNPYQKDGGSVDIRLGTLLDRRG